MRLLLVFFLMASVIFSFSSCTIFQPKETFEETQAWDNAKEAESADAVDALTQFIETYPKSRHRAEAYYFRGQEHLARGNYAMAEKDFNAAFKIGKPGFIKGYALAGLGHVNMENEEFEEATHYYKKALKSRSKGLREDEILYQLGKASQRSGRWNEADTYFIRVTSEFPASDYAGSAREKIAASEKYFSVQTGAFDLKKSAAALEKKLADSGYRDVLTKEVHRSGKIRFCVRVGKFQTWHSARRMQERLKADKYDTLIVP